MNSLIQHFKQRQSAIEFYKGIKHGPLTYVENGLYIQYSRDILRILGD